MESSYFQLLLQRFKNVVLNTVGVERDFLTLIQDGDVSKALDMMQNHDKDVDIAISEYNPMLHSVMKRPNKQRRNMPDYESEKLPRARARYINEVELFFLLGKDLVNRKKGGDDEAYKDYLNFWDEKYINTKVRQLKRIAGSELESAIVFHLYGEGENIGVDAFIASRSRGYALRPLFDQYGNLVAFAYGYCTNEGGKNIQHWDFQTSEFFFNCTKRNGMWDVETYPNPAHKILVLYANQDKSWDGVEGRISREEMLDSKIADTNNYFADPIAAATADVVQTMTKKNQGERIGKLIQLTGDDSRFEYINPPQDSAARESEKKELEKSILFDTFTPDFSVENMRGLGTLSGVAIKNAMILGFIKRANRIEYYGELVGRLRNVIIAILGVLHPSRKSLYDALDIDVTFAEPFDTDKYESWSAIRANYEAGLMSIETAVQMLAFTDAPDEEIARLQQTPQQVVEE